MVASATMPLSRKGAALLIATFAMAFAAPAPAFAENLRRASLEYFTSETASCPDEHALRQQVAKRLGADPFQQSAEVIFRVTVLLHGGRYTATIVAADAGGSSTTRSLDDGSCQALVDSIASTIALAIDPIGGAARAPAPAPILSESAGPTGPIVDRARYDEPNRVRPPSPRPKPLGLSISPTATIDAVAHVGLASNPTFGARLGLGLASPRASMHAEGSAEATAAAGGAQDEVVGQVYAAHVVPCLAVTGPWLVCASVDLGVVRARARLGTLPDYAVDPIVGLGARAGLRLPIGRVWAFRAQLEGGGLAVRAAYIVDGRRAASTGPVFFGLAFGLEARAP